MESAQGFHLVLNDVADKFGSATPGAVERIVLETSLTVSLSTVDINVGARTRVGPLPRCRRVIPLHSCFSGH